MQIYICYLIGMFATLTLMVFVTGDVGATTATGVISATIGAIGCAAWNWHTER